MEQQLQAAKRSIHQLEDMADQLEDVRDMLKVKKDFACERVRRPVCLHEAYELMAQIPPPPVISPQGGTVLSAAGEACEFQILDNGQVKRRGGVSWLRLDKS